MDTVYRSDSEEFRTSKNDRDGTSMRGEGFQGIQACRGEKPAQCQVYAAAYLQQLQREAFAAMQRHRDN